MKECFLKEKLIGVLWDYIEIQKYFMAEEEISQRKTLRKESLEIK